MAIVKKIFFVDGMQCVSCENNINKKLEGRKGIIKVNASYSKGKVEVDFDESLVNQDDIKSIITGLDYEIVDTMKKLDNNEKLTKTRNITNSKKNNNFDFVQFICILIILFSILNIMRNLGVTDVFNSFPTATENMGYFALFVIGLLTSVHCVAMCGGINISQCANIKYTEGSIFSRLTPSIQYNVGRVISYTVVGFVVGAIGSVFQLSGVMSGFVAIVAGIFMIIMGLNMLNIFPWLRKFNPRLPKIFFKFNKNRESSGPVFVGLLNGLMPCGPLQAMQLYALSTGSPIKGALSMFFFSLGTLPLMFGLGAISSILTKSFTNKMMMVSGVLVAVLGVGMLNTGLSLSGFNTISITSENSLVAEVEGGEQTVVVDVSSRGYEPVTVKKGIPVNLVFRADEGDLNSCNFVIKIPKYGIKQKLDYGDTIVHFTPTETGKIPYSCYMGMIRSSITVVD